MGELFVFPINTHLSINSHQIDIHASLKRENNQTKSSFDIDNALDYYIHNEGDVDDDDINFIIIIVIIIFIINININIIEKKIYELFSFSGNLLVIKDKTESMHGGVQPERDQRGVLQEPLPSRQLDPSDVHVHGGFVLLAGTDRGRS